jgi:hypothetical protein
MEILDRSINIQHRKEVRTRELHVGIVSMYVLFKTIEVGADRVAQVPRVPAYQVWGPEFKL